MVTLNDPISVCNKMNALARLTSEIKTYMFNLDLSEQGLAEKLKILPVGVQNLNESRPWSIDTVFEVSNKLNLQIEINVTNGSKE